MDTDRIERLIAARKSGHHHRGLTAAAADRLLARATSVKRVSISHARKERAIQVASEVAKRQKRTTR